MTFLAKLRAYAREHALWEPGMCILIACSGGPDSMALLSALLKIRAEEGLTVCVAHFHHGIRGTEADADAAYVADFCKSHDVPLFLTNEDIPAYAAKTHLSLETAARERRYAFLHAVADRLGSKTRIAVAHHADDQAETVLMRILRGTGLDGLAAMRPRTGNLIRPLLSHTRADIEAYCATQSLSPRHDATNDLLDATRNRIRHELLPTLREAYNPQITQALCRLAETAADESDFHTLLTADVFPSFAAQMPNGYRISRACFIAHPATLRHALLRHLAQALGISNRMGYVHYQSLARLITDGTTGERATLPGGATATVSYDAAYVTRQRDADRHIDSTQDVQKTTQPISMCVPGETLLPFCGMRVSVTMQQTMPADLGAHVIAVDADDLPQPWLVRTREPGDTLLIEAGTQKLKKLLIDRKIPQAQRDKVPIFLTGDHIFWVGGVRQAQWGRVHAHTQRFARIELSKT